MAGHCRPSHETQLPGQGVECEWTGHAADCCALAKLRGTGGIGEHIIVRRGVAVEALQATGSLQRDVIGGIVADRLVEVPV